MRQNPKRLWMWLSFGLCLVLFGSSVEGGDQADLTPGQRVALDFAARELPRLHKELLLVLNEMPETRDSVLEEFIELRDIHRRYEEMSPELAAIFIAIKRREFDNQVFAEKIHQIDDQPQRERAFKQLVAHMDVTFDLNLKLVRGELAWLEEEVRHIRKVAETEQLNKKRYIKEDLESLLLNNQPLLDLTISGLGRQQTERHRTAIQKLIEVLPPQIKPVSGVEGDEVDDGATTIDERLSHGPKGKADLGDRNE